MSQITISMEEAHERYMHELNDWAWNDEEEVQEESTWFDVCDKATDEVFDSFLSEEDAEDAVRWYHEEDGFVGELEIKERKGDEYVQL